MKKIGIYLAALLLLVLTLFGCGTEDVVVDGDALAQQDGITDEDNWSEAENDSDESEKDTNESEPDTDGSETEELETEAELIDEEGYYTSPEDVALYIHTYGELPGNFITKKEAEALGWNSKEGNLDEVAPGMSIGGNRFGNYEQILPDGDYKECDVNYEGGYRGDERIVYDADGDIYYTDDHYASFTQLYWGEE